MALPGSEIPLPTLHSPPTDLSHPPDLSALHGLTILITGGASGLGAGMARHWAHHGAHIIIGDRNRAQGESLTADLRTDTGSLHHHFVPVDVTSWSGQLGLFEEAVRLSPHGGIDCVVANAGIASRAESDAFENPADYHALLTKSDRSGTAAAAAAPPSPPRFHTLDVNLTGLLYTAHLAQAYLPLNPGSSPCSPSPFPFSSSSPQNRDRHLLLVSSLAGLRPLPTHSLYTTSKHAVVGLFRSLRLTAPLRHGIRVNMLCPWFTRTPILGSVGNAFLAGARGCEVETVVEAATRLVVERAVVGRALAVGVVYPDKGGGGVEGGKGERVVGLTDGKVEVDDDAGWEDEMERVNAGSSSHGIWEVYGHDFEQSDIVARRVLGITNLLVARRGTRGIVADLTALLWASIIVRWTVVMVGGGLLVLVLSVVYGG